MLKRTIPHDAFVFVGDGRKALFLRNEGDEKFPNLVFEQVFAEDNPPTHEQGADRPGRRFAHAGADRRGAVEPTDWHELEEHRFAQRVVGAFEHLARERNTPALIIIAPPRTLAEVRDAMDDDLKGRIAIEINKDLTKHPVSDIEKHVVDALHEK